MTTQLLVDVFVLRLVVLAIASINWQLRVVVHFLIRFAKYRRVS